MNFLQFDIEDQLRLDFDLQEKKILPPTHEQ